MSQVRRNDLRPDSDVTPTDDNQFKKSFQTVGKPPVTERDMHEDFMRDPPNVRNILALVVSCDTELSPAPQNKPFEPSSERNPPGKKEGGWAFDEDTTEEEKVLGDEVRGKQTKEAALQAQTEEDSIHSNNTV